MSFFVFFSQKAINNNSFVFFLICQITVFVLQQRKNEDIVVQIRPI